MRQFTCITLLFVMGVSSTGFAQDKKLPKLLEEWKSAKAKAKKSLLRVLDQKVTALKKDRTVDAELRNQRIAAINDQKATFEKTGEVPESNELLSASLAYLDALHKDSQEVRKFFADELEKAVGTGDEFNQIQVAKKAWEQDLPGIDELGAQTEFHGTIWFVDRATDLHLHVSKMDGSIFICDIWRDVANINLKRGWRFTGKLDGNQLTLVSTETLVGPPGSLELRGYIVGRRMVMAVALAGGKPPKNPSLISIWKK